MYGNRTSSSGEELFETTPGDACDIWYRAGAMCACSGVCLPVLHDVFALYKVLVPLDVCLNKRINEQTIDVGDGEGAKNRYALKVGPDSAQIRDTSDRVEICTKGAPRGQLKNVLIIASILMPSVCF